MSAAKGGSQWGEKKREAYWSRSCSLFQRWMYSCLVLAFSVSLNNYLLFTLLHPGHLLSLGHMPTSTGILSACCFLTRFFHLQQLLNQDLQWLTTKSQGALCFSSCAITCDITPSSATTHNTVGVRENLVRSQFGWVQFYKFIKIQIQWTFDRNAKSAGKNGAPQKLSSSSSGAMTPYNNPKSQINYLISTQSNPTKNPAFPPIPQIQRHSHRHMEIQT